MKNFLLAVALLSIGTAVAADYSNLSLTEKAAILKQKVIEVCHKEMNDAVAKMDLNEDQRQKLGLEPTKKMCECTGRKLENRVRKGLEVDPDLYYKYKEECGDAVLHRKH